MIKFINIDPSKPYHLFMEYYNKANNMQNAADAIVISSLDLKKNEVDSRYVNLKIIDGKEFIFFSNYDSPKSYQFKTHNQISSLMYWSSLNIKVRIKANIKKIPKKYSDSYFKDRDISKNALAISSNQSKKIDSYESVVKNYHEVLDKDCLVNRPSYWGGFAFVPYYFEFWEGQKSRLNRRDVYILDNGNWDHCILQP